MYRHQFNEQPSAEPTRKQKPRHSRLVSEMAKDLTRRSDSIASSTGSKHGTVSPDSTQSSGFNPERHGANMSTRQLTDNSLSKKLPQIRETAKKCGRWAPRPQPTHVIDTSAIGRAFPDFTGGMSSDDDYSVEIGRGNYPPKVSNNSATNNIYADISNDSPVVSFSNHQIVNTPHNPNAVSSKFVAASSKPFLQERNNFNQNTATSADTFNHQIKKAYIQQRNTVKEITATSTDTFNLERKTSIFDRSHKSQRARNDNIDKENHINAAKDLRKSIHDYFDNEQKENIPPANQTNGSPYTSNASQVNKGKSRALQPRVSDENDGTDLAELSNFTSSSFNPSPDATNNSYEIRTRDKRPPFNLNDYAHLLPDDFVIVNNVDNNDKEDAIVEPQSPPSLISEHTVASEGFIQSNDDSVNLPHPKDTFKSHSRPSSRASSRASSVRVQSNSDKHGKRISKPIASAPSPSSKARTTVTKPTSAKPPQTSASKVKSLKLVQNPTQSSFVAPNTQASSEPNTASFDVGVPVSVKNGLVRPRNAHSKNPHFERVGGFDLPDEEEDIYLMCEKQKILIGKLEREATEYKLKIDNLGMANIQLEHEQGIANLASNLARNRRIEFEALQEKHQQLQADHSQLGKDHAQLKTQNDAFKKHRCVDEQLQMNHGQLKGDYAQLQQEYAELKVQYEDLQNHVCVDEKLELEHAKLKLDLAQFNVEKKEWREHQCVDLALEQELLELKSAKKAWESHQCRDVELEQQTAQLRKEVQQHHKIRESITSINIQLEQQATHLRKDLENSQKTRESMVTRNKELEQQAAQLEKTLKTWEKHECKDTEREAEIAQLRLEKKAWEAHCRTDSAIGDSSDERDSSSNNNNNQNQQQVQNLLDTSFQQQEVDMTLRPTMAPAMALNQLLSNIENEIGQLKRRLTRYAAKYNIADGKVGKSERMRVEGTIKQLVDQISKKSDVLYLLHDIELGLQ